MPQCGCRHALLSLQDDSGIIVLSLAISFQGLPRADSWNLQSLIREKFSFGPAKTALERRLQLPELLLKAEGVYKLLFGPWLPSRCQTCLLGGKAGEEWACWCGWGISNSQISPVGEA